MPVVAIEESDLLRSEGHRSELYGSFLVPTVLWSARVNGAHDRGETTITFDGGAGADFDAIDLWQTVWIGTSAGEKDIGITRVRNLTSGDAGVTGTLEVAPNWFPWVDDMYITFLHDYRLQPMYPYIDPDTEVFYKDGDIAYTDQNENLTPVVVVNFTHRACFIDEITGEAVFWFDASPSYAMQPGATISSYAASIYPTTGATITIDSSTGKGKIVCTDTTKEYYWCKFTVTDSNGKSQYSYRCIFAHSPDPSDNTYPHIDFRLNQASGEWDRGGYHAQIVVNDESTFDEIPENTFCILWRKSVYGIDKQFATVIPDHYDSRVEYYNPKVSYSMVPNGANWDVTVTFYSGILVDGEFAYNNYEDYVLVYISLNGGGSQYVIMNTLNGMVSGSTTFTNVQGTGTILVQESDEVYDLVSEPYYAGNETSAEAEWPAQMMAYPQHLIVGYLRSENIQQSYAPQSGHGSVTYEITTIEDLLKNQYMFSVSLASRPDGEVGKWYEIRKELSIGMATWHLWKWHSSLFEVADVRGLRDNTDGRAYAEFEGGSLYTMPDNMARNAGIRAHITCNIHGQLNLTQDVQLLNEDERSYIDVIMEIGKDDRSAELGLLHNDEDETAFVYVSGLAFNQTYSPNENGDLAPDVEPYCATAPGKVPSGSGENVVNLERQVLRSQQHANEIAGRVYAQVNNPYPEFRVKFHGDYWNICDISLAEFWFANIDLSDTIRNVYWYQKLMIIRQVSIAYRPEAGTIQVNATFEPLADGYDGVSAPCFGNMPVLPGTPVLPQIRFLLPGTAITSSD